MAIHPTAIVESGAQIDESAEIGPYCIVGPDVTIGACTRLMAHVFVDGITRIGEDNVFFPYSTVGVAPQDLKYKGERSQTHIGNRNCIREFAAIHRGTEGGGMITSIGDDNLAMANLHIAHDVRVGNHTVLSHGTTIGGHVLVEDWAVIGAHSGIHQFCRIGKHSMIGGYSVVTQDVLPFSMTVSPREIHIFGANKTGLERRGFPAATIDSLQKAFRLLTKAGLNTTQAIERILAEVPQVPEREDLIEFLKASTRGFVK